MFLSVLSELFLVMQVECELFQKIQILASFTAYFVNFDGYCMISHFKPTLLFYFSSNTSQLHS